MTARVSVLMPVHNGAAYVGEAIASVLSQTLADLELLIMDDGSTDGTPDILERYATQDGRVRVFLRRHQGQIATRNELLRLASADLVACADADDICMPDRMQRQLEVMVASPDLWILGTAAVTIDEKGRRQRSWRVPTGRVAVSSELERRCCIVHPSCMMRVAHILEMGGYRPAYESAEDYDLFLRASEQGKVDNLGMVGLLYRQHGGNVSHRHNVRQAISTDLARATYFARLAGRSDPTEGLSRAPDLDDPLFLDLLPPSQLSLYRAMATAMDANAAPGAIKLAAETLAGARVGGKHTRACQQAIVRLIHRRPFDRLSCRLLLRAVAFGPVRLLRLLVKEARARKRCP